MWNIESLLCRWLQFLLDMQTGQLPVQSASGPLIYLNFCHKFHLSICSLNRYVAVSCNGSQIHKNYRALIINIFIVVVIIIDMIVVFAMVSVQPIVRT